MRNMSRVMDEHELYLSLSALSAYYHNQKAPFDLPPSALQAIREGAGAVHLYLGSKTENYHRWSTLLSWQQDGVAEYDDHLGIGRLPATANGQLAKKWWSKAFGESTDTSFIIDFCRNHGISVFFPARTEESITKTIGALKDKHHLRKTTYYYVLLVFNSPQQVLDELHLLSQRKALFDLSKEFYEKVSGSEIVQTLASECLDNNSNIVHPFTIRRDSISIKYKSQPFAERGMKILPSIESCAGLGFAVAEAIIKRKHGETFFDLATTSMISAVPSRSVYNNTDYSYITFEVRNPPQSETIIATPELREW